MERRLNVKMKGSRKDADWEVRFLIGFAVVDLCTGYLSYSLISDIIQISTR